jgi:hypothetical protein
VPLAFSAAGELDPTRVDEVIARVNLFNYAGAILGAVLVGLLADAPGLGLAFLLSAVLVAPTAVSARRFGMGRGRAGDAIRRSPTRGSWGARRPRALRPDCRPRAGLSRAFGPVRPEIRCSTCANGVDRSESSAAKDACPLRI